MRELEDVIDEKSFRIAVFIDDLDRCLPEKVVELLEAIKLFLDIAGYLFVIGVDREVVKKGISCRYRFFEHRDEKEKEGLVISPDDYLDKMIQLPLELPVIEQGRKRKFIEALLDDSVEFKKHADIIEAGVGDNPRTLKRLVNLLAFIVTLAETLKDNILHDKFEPKESDEHKELIEAHFIPILYIKWSVIVFRYPKEHNTIKGNNKRLIELQQLAARGCENVAAVEAEKAEKEDAPIEISDALRKVLAKGAQFPDDDWLIKRFIHLTESTIVSTGDRAAGMAFHHRYKPGDMVEIPKGIFLYGDDKIEKDIPYDYHMDVFPVTNRQYKEFVDAEKREVPYRDADPARPYNWDKEKTYPKGLDDHPVVLVTFDDAVAYCKWRSEKEGITDKNHYRLPTEVEWEKAARGTDGRVYPWGNDFDFRRLNCADYHVQKVLKDKDEWRREFLEKFYEKNKEKALTSEVGRFADGESPYHCLDMAANVWEWTDSWYEKDESRVVRGGSWLDVGDFCRCANRNRYYPLERFYDLGFRCARTL